ncbi:leucine-rich repeat and death domain-containing protein 1-like [Plakobranchus ocellatus]|uniref:Leucine-rich repeat and death domain-containing protein 1-like n=1 Tax=Plakobranchus ocellatus TaxID=259542 RepID=A0AAV3Z4R6_9GAST|nr:leucine-rich repeat and death domain-containing protein 1-like [Plakobranchus ocellatus]
MQVPPMDVCVSGVMQPIGLFLRRAFRREELLMDRMFHSMREDLNKSELRALLKKLRIPEDHITELEQKYPGRDQVGDRIVAGLRHWREYFGPAATIDELIRITHIINFEAVSSKLRTMKVYAQRLRL